MLAGAVGLLAPAPAAQAAAVGNCTIGSDWPAPRDDFAQQVVALVNQHRASIGITTPLKVSPTLTGSARWKASHMARYSYMQHDDPAPPVARTVSQRLEACGYPALKAGWGENIAAGQTTPQQVMNSWLNSSGHRANIENPSFKAIGVGAAASSQGRTYWAQNFGTYDDSGSPTPPPPPSSMAGYHRAGTVTCTSTFPQMRTGAPVVYALGDPSSFQFVFWRTNYFRWNGSLYAYVFSAPWYYAAVSTIVAADYWYNYETGAYLGQNPSLVQAPTLPSGGYWATTQDFVWFNRSWQQVGGETLQTAVTQGPNAIPGNPICHF